MALHSSRYRRPEQQDELIEPKIGLMSYDDPAHGFHEWGFMRLAKLDSTNAEDHMQLAGKVISSLRGGAMLVAMEIGRVKLFSHVGIKSLVKDAGRGFGKQIRSDIVATGLNVNAVMRALYYQQVDGDIKVLMVTRVDDVMWASKPGSEHVMGGLVEKCQLREVEKGFSRFCGREVEQTEDGSVFVTCWNTAEKVEPVRFRSRKPDDDAAPKESTQLCSVVGSVGWVAMQCRPHLADQVLRLQTVMGKAQVNHLVDTSRMVRDCAETPVSPERKPLCMTGKSHTDP